MEVADFAKARSDEGAKEEEGIREKIFWLGANLRKSILHMVLSIYRE